MGTLQLRGSVPGAAGHARAVMFAALVMGFGPLVPRALAQDPSPPPGAEAAAVRLIAVARPRASGS